LASLVGKLAKIPGVEDLSLTTNGTRLEGQAAALKQAGLQRVTVSLDSLDAVRFKAITRSGDLQMVWQGLLAADQAGLGPIKINCVVLPENEADLLPLAALTLERSWEVRFIEAMPVSAALGHSIKPGLSLTTLKQRLSERWGALEAVATDAHAPARRWRLPHSLGKLGFIASVSESFCSACDRLRLSATGRLQLCMAHPDGLDLRPLLRGGSSDAQISEAIAAAVWRKPAGHSFFQTPVPAGLAMSQIGG
jgi:cyclic pyranopterin phosphate synthase